MVETETYSCFVSFGGLFYQDPAKYMEGEEEAAADTDESSDESSSSSSSSSSDSKSLHSFPSGVQSGI